jgi:hypothetical protein
MVTAEGGNVSHFLLWFPGLLWRLHLLRTQPLISVFWGWRGSVGKAYLGLSGAGALQSVVVCWCPQRSGRSVGSVRSGQGGRCFEATCLFESGCGIVGCVVVRLGFVLLISLAFPGFWLWLLAAARRFFVCQDIEASNLNNALVLGIETWRLVRLFALILVCFFGASVTVLGIICLPCEPSELSLAVVLGISGVAFPCLLCVRGSSSTMDFVEWEDRIKYQV